MAAHSTFRCVNHTSTRGPRHESSCIMYIYLCLQVDSRRAERWPSTRRSPAARSWGAWRPSPAGYLSTSRCAAPCLNSLLHSIFLSGPRLGTFRQCYGTGTVATVTFFRRGTGIGTIINYGSGSVIKLNHTSYQRHKIKLCI